MNVLQIINSAIHHIENDETDLALSDLKSISSYLNSRNKEDPSITPLSRALSEFQIRYSRDLTNCWWEMSESAHDALWDNCFPLYDAAFTGQPARSPQIKEVHGRPVKINNAVQGIILTDGINTVMAVSHA